MATWNADKPALVNQISADIPDIEENFQELHDVIEVITNGTLGTTEPADFEVTTISNEVLFYVRGGTQSNITINNSVTVIFGTELYDAGNDFASNTFTAPVSGFYHLSVHVPCQSVDRAASRYRIQLVTSNRTIHIYFDSDMDLAGDGDVDFVFSMATDMDINDTASVKIYQSGGTQQTDISTAYFSGYLISAV